MGPARAFALSILLIALVSVCPLFSQSSGSVEPAASKSTANRQKAKKTRKKQTRQVKKSSSTQAQAAAKPQAIAGRDLGQFDNTSSPQRRSENVPDDAVWKAMQQRARLEQTRIKLFGADLPGTTQLGPTWTPLGPGVVNGPEGTATGRITTIAVDPGNPDTLYVGASGGGVWKSADGGGAWQPLSDNLTSLVSGALAFDPRIGLLYYGTGDYGQRRPGAGLFRSSDGGATWASASGWDSTLNKPQFTGGVTAKIVLHPSDPRTIYAARDKGLWRTTDGGDTWYRLTGGEISGFALDQNNPNRMFVALGYIYGSTGNGIYRSDDGGATWMALPGLPMGTQLGRVTIAMAPSNPAILYAVFTRSSDWQLLSAYRSNDSGNTWAQIPAPASLFDSNGRGHGHFDNCLEVDPVDPNTVYAGGVELWKSTDAGNTWNVLSLSGAGRVIHEDQFAIAFRPGSSNVVYVGNDGGMYRSNDGGATWTSLNSELPVSQFNSIAADPTGGQTLLGGTQDQGLIRYNGTRMWDQLFRGDAGAVMFAPDASAIYCAKQLLRPVRSTDGGVSFTNIGESIAASDAVAFYPPFISTGAQGQTLYFGTNRVWLSTNGGSNWTAISSDLTNGQYLTALAVGPDGKIYAGSYDGRISVSNGAFWVPGGGIPANRTVTSIAPDMRNPSIAYLTVDWWGNGHVFKTVDGGATWSDVTGNLPDAPAYGAVIDAAGSIYVATEVGVFRSDDSGASWVSFNLGLPNVVVKGLAIGSGKLFAATYGRGVYQIDLTTGTGPGPAFFSKGVGNVFNGLDNTMAPGLIAMAFGVRLTTGATEQANGAPPLQLAGTSVTVNGIPAPLFFASPGQINFQVPFEVTGTEALIVITTAQGSASLTAPLSPAAPGLFGGTVMHQDYSVVSSNNPMFSGEVLVLYATGLGATNPAVPTGALSPVDVLAHVSASVTCSFNGIPGDIVFAGLTPGLASLYQVNVRVPAGLTPGNVTFTVSVGNRASNTISLPAR